MSETDLQDYLAFHLKKNKKLQVFTRIKLPGRHLPDIDLLLLDKEQKLTAIETKYLKPSINTKFYMGIDEALALLFYGVDHVYLLQALDQNAKTISLTKTLLQDIPIGYMILIGRSMPNTIKEAPQNPFKTLPIARKNREDLEKILQIRI